MAVASVLQNMNLQYTDLELGKVTLPDPVSAETLAQLDTQLKVYELELVTNRKKILVDSIKVAIVELFDDSNRELPARFSEYLSKTLFHNYIHLSNVFSECEGSTIERFYIETRLRKAKDLLLSMDISINQLAGDLGFNSAAHFCLQFKKMTGKTPGKFRNQINDKELV